MRVPRWNRARNKMPKKNSDATKPLFTELPPVFAPRKIVSGGQTGVDRAGLELAILLGIDHGGWCPRGRLAEDGRIPDQYSMQEMSVTDYKARTRQNVIDSDATLILYERKLSGGTALTRGYALELAKPFLCLQIERKATEAIANWLNQQQPNVLNIAGPRESTSPGIQSRAMDVLLRLYFA